MSADIELTEWYLVRHAPVKNSKKGIYKEADAEAELPPHETIMALAKALPEEADWYVSPMARARTTADALLRAIDLRQKSLSYPRAITEQDFGEWQGLSFEEIWEKMKGLEAHNWSLLSAHTTPENGESFEDVTKRVSNFMNDHIAEKNGRPKVLVTHAGIIRAFTGIALGLDPNKSLALEAKPFSLTRLLHQTGQGQGGQWQLQCLNQQF